jgi:hypothetical protein
MRKIELVYLHELLSLVREEYEQGPEHAVDCEEYDRLQTYPQAIDQPKAKHNEAVRALACDLTTAVAEQSSPETETAAEAPAAHQ